MIPPTSGEKSLVDFRPLTVYQNSSTGGLLPTQMNFFGAAYVVCIALDGNPTV